MREPARRALPVLVGEAAEPEEVLREATLAVLGSKVRVDLTRPVVRRPACTRPPGVQIQVCPLEELRLLRHACRVGRDAPGRDAVQIVRIARPDDHGPRAVRLYELAHAA